MIQVGCSGIVWPAALLPQEAAAHGAQIITIDPRESAGDVWLRGTAAEILPALVEMALGESF
jgi:NAD-dependent deacetylase